MALSDRISGRNQLQPSFYKDRVLFGSQDATLYCLDAATGKEVWKHTIDDQIRCSPTVVGNRTFLAGCDAKFHIVDLDTGKGLTKVDIRDQTGSVPAVLGDRVYFGSEGGTFFCIDWKAAKVVWTYPDEEHSQAFRASAAVTENAVIFGRRDKRVHALNPKDSETLWTFTTSARVDSSPIIAGNRVYVGSATAACMPST